MRTLIYTLALLLIALFFIAIGANLFPVVSEKVIYTRPNLTISNELTKENVSNMIDYLDMQMQRSVLKQCLLESNLKSNFAVKHNNILGLTHADKPIHFNSVIECLIYYKYRFNVFFKGGTEKEYFEYLERCRYFRDRNYYLKIKGVRL
jgi:hypothetical protein